jgi:hypothetical protein
MDMSIKGDERQPSASPDSATVAPTEDTPQPEVQVREPLPRGRPRKLDRATKVKEPKVRLAAKREKGLIAYPWYDLDTAVTVVRTIVDAGGLPMTRDQLAGALRIVPTGGNFILKVALLAARPRSRISARAAR